MGGSALAQLDDVLVVLVRDRLPGDALLIIARGLVLEDRLQEELLQLLVGEIDAELPCTGKMRSTGATASGTGSGRVVGCASRVRQAPARTS